MASDVTNPLGLDYSGLNFAETLQRDEQGRQNTREYLNLKRTVAKYTLHTFLSEKLRNDNRSQKFGVPVFFDVAKDDSDDSSIVEEAPGPVRIVRTMQKASNAAKWNEESTRRENVIKKVIRQEIEAENTVPKVETSDEFIELDLMLDDLKNINDSLIILSDEVGQPTVRPNRCRRNRTYPQNLTEFECSRKATAAYRQAFNEKIKIATEHYADGDNEAPILKIMKKTILEENASVASASSSNCVVGEFDRDDFGLNVGLKSGDRRYQLEGFRNPIRTNLEPNAFDDEQTINTRCITRGEWLKEILPQRTRKIQKSRSIDRIDAAINYDNSVNENNQKKFVGGTMKKTETVESRSVLVKPRRKQIAPYFGTEREKVSEPVGSTDSGIQLPKVRSLDEDGFIMNNLCEPKCEFTKKFKVRRHRIHKDPTKHKEAMVFYQPKVSTKIENPMDANATDSNIESSDDAESDSLGVEKEAYVSTLIRRQNSIEACNSSESSSVCSNYGENSGSDIYFGDVPMPLRHLTKSYDPYEEANRAGVEATRLQDRKESEEAYYKVPYPGQLQDMRKLMSQKIGTKLRPTPSNRGRAAEYDIMNKYIFYPKKINVHQMIEYLRELSRIQFAASVYESNEQILPLLRRQLAEQEMAFDQKFREFGNLDSALSTRLVEAKRKSNTLEKKLNACQRECDRLKSRILEDEKCMREKMAYQKLIYLLMDKQWRLKYDWLHKKKNGSLECVAESIRKRYKSRMRATPTNDAFDVKDFYEKRLSLYARAKPRNALMDTQSFLRAMDGLTVKPIICTLNSICRFRRLITVNTCAGCLNDVITHMFSKYEAQNSNQQPMP